MVGRSLRQNRSTETIVQLFENLVEQGKTVLMATHDIDLARRATRIVTITDGKIVEGLKSSQAARYHLVKGEAIFLLSHLTRAVTFMTFHRPQMRPIKPAGSFTLSAFTGDQFKTVAAIALVRPGTPLYVEDFFLTLYTDTPSHKATLYSSNRQIFGLLGR